MDDADNIPVAAVAVEPDYQPTLSYDGKRVPANGGPDQNKPASACLPSARSSSSSSSSSASTSSSSGASSSTVQRRLSEKEKREAADRLYLVLPEAAEAQPWYANLLQVLMTLNVRCRHLNAVFVTTFKLLEFSENQFFLLRRVTYHID